MKNQAENIIKYYMLCNKLKNLIRTGWKDWKVKTDRIESVAEHIYGTQMLAIAMKSEFKYDIDLEKVIKMLAVHETEEIVIGDLTLFDIERSEKERLGHEAIKKIFANLIDGKEYVKLILEFDERKTNEAKFAYFCDKLEADLQARIYDLKGCVSSKLVKKNKRYKTNSDVKRLFDSGLSWGQMWLEFGRERYNYDDNFLAVSKLASDEKVKEIFENLD